VRNVTTHTIAIIAGLVIAYLFNIGMLYYIFNLFQAKTFSEFTDIEVVKIVHFIFWFISISVLVYSFILFNYSWKNKFIKDDLKGWEKHVSNIVVNLLLYILFATIAFLVSKGITIDHSKFSFTYFIGKFIFAAISALIIASLLIAYNNSKWNEQLIAQLKLEKRNSELQGLKEQLSPHFFFNTLNTLSGLIRIGNKTDSLDFVDSLSDVYRYILDSQNNDTVKVSDEITFIEAYIYLLKKRFGKSIEFDISLNSLNKDEYIPPLSIQILIENVVKHNVFSEAEPLHISIKQKSDYVIVSNNIQEKPYSSGHGIGLTNLNKRVLLISDKEIKIHSDQRSFSVSIPVLK